MKNLFLNSYKWVLVAVTISLLFTATACDLFTTKETTEKQVIKPKGTLLVFFKDQSASVKTDSTSRETTIKWVKAYLNDYLQPNTDVLVTAIDNYSSVTTTNHDYFLWVSSPKEDNTQVKSEEELQLEQLEQNTKSKSKIREIKNAVIEKLFKVNTTEERANQTAILETIPYLAKLDYTSIRIVYLCDLVQESGRRDFTKTSWPMPSKEFAQNLAKQDARILIKEFNIQNGFEKVKSISVLIPQSASKAHLNNLNHYWDVLFLKLGFRHEVQYITGVF